ncbi:DUF6199 family natural product biosynthesis protein [Bifidobacterium scardovii]|uniref:Nickel ABC transporter permease n=1 Tax=Bifidobacterium scardovii TaxID=158787 RepID=A0A087DIE7_9BIFI|nr:DUF6199 family natural product biosynthesis protein [Bifidobacterium scardovii]KFI95297.1 nickel ABC transporter permease [Bifidobacterium scardovii]MDK6349761.1 hypothetical protein [Bifidobacterium scardovii]MDU8981717.1 hypothetical protein [Bifidobacterium scardovii]BAQ31145.1 hypothetical protein BBSC_1065 [Bifidobacterium scardovii JCM 12489 = DSM 13734]
MLIVAIVLMEIVIVAIGVFMIWKPEILWKIENFLSVKGGEPTEFYLAMQRVGGVLLLVLSVFLPFIVLATQ